MSASSFIDTNVFVYLFDSTAPDKQRRARALVKEALDSGTGAISLQVVQEFVNAMLRNFRNAAHGPDLALTLQELFEPMLTVSPSMDLISAALELHGRYQFSWYDALIVAAALEARCRVLYSEDLRDGMKIGELTIVNPFK